MGIRTNVATGSSLAPFYSAFGKLNLSVDGLGTHNNSGTVQVDKASRNATVRAAFLLAASAGFTGYEPTTGDVLLDSEPVNWNPEYTIANSIRSVNVLADVTDQVRKKVNPAPVGRVDFTVGETHTDEIDGEALVVVLNDPAVPKPGTVALLYGAQATAGDHIRFTEPLEKADPNLALRMSLGISYSAQYKNSPIAPQFTDVNINGQLLTSAAGGQDDGELDNGALFTVGGLGDDLGNPPDPHGSELACGEPPRCDDELYNLLPFVKSGDTTIDVTTNNPSADDNVFFAAFQMNAVAAVVDEGAILRPGDQEFTVGYDRSFSVLVQDEDGRPLRNRPVRFSVISGPNAGLTLNDVTSNRPPGDLFGSGYAYFKYASKKLGTDVVQASFIDDRGRRKYSNSVTMTWIASEAVRKVPHWNYEQPLLVAHGISDTPAGMKDTKDHANRAIKRPKIIDANTGAVTGVWTNAAQIVKDVKDFRRNNPTAPPLNALVHSKGGLDTRAAMLMSPRDFGDLAMLDTPNHGSPLATIACEAKMTGANPWADKGPCKTSYDALFDLMPWWVEDFNHDYPDQAGHRYAVAGANCTTAKCRGSKVLARCPIDGDDAVCQSSAFALTAGRGRHYKIPKIYKGYDHHAMKVRPCPTVRLINWLYPPNERSGIRCEDLEAKALTDATADSDAGTAEPLEPETGADQTLTVVKAVTASQAVDVPLDPEGGDAVTVLLLLRDGTTPQVSVDSPGRVSSLEPTSIGDLSGTVFTVDGLAGQRRVMHVHVDQETDLAVATTLPEAEPMVASASVTSDGKATVVATMKGVGVPQAAGLNVVAEYNNEVGVRQSVALAWNKQVGGFTASLAVPAGDYVPITVTMSGARERKIMTGIRLPDKSGTIGPISGDELADTDADGGDDVLRLPVPVTVNGAGRYQVVLTLADQSGQAVSRALGQADLPTGKGLVDVDVDLNALIRGGVDGPYLVRDAMLTEGEAASRKVAVRADLGHTAPYAVARLTSDRVVMTEPSAQVIDQQGDGRPDLLRWTNSATVPVPGQYRLTGELRDPADGVALEVDKTVTLGMRGNLTVDVPAAVLSRGPAGVFTLENLNLEYMLETSLEGSADTGYSPEIDPAAWSAKPTCDGRIPTLKVTPGRTLQGTRGDDVIMGTDGTDRINGGGGDDVICAGAGTDVVLGGDGNDFVFGGDGPDSINGGPGDDRISGEGGDDTISAGAGNDYVDGGDGNDTLVGHDGDDVLRGGNGNDRLNGLTGAGSMAGGDGNDVLTAGDGADTVTGDAGDDVVSGGSGNDSLRGDNGNDTITGGDGDDEILGGAGADTLLGNAGNDVLRGEDGDDLLRGQDGDDALYGGAGADVLDGGRGRNVLVQ